MPQESLQDKFSACSLISGGVFEAPSGRRHHPLVVDPLQKVSKINQQQQHPQKSRRVNVCQGSSATSDKSTSSCSSSDAAPQSGSITHPKATFALLVRDRKDRRSLSVPRRQGTLSDHAIEDFGPAITHHLQSLEQKESLHEFLSTHAITSEYRAKMIDWMGEVLHTFKTSDQTFFLAVSLMDRFFKLSARTLSSSDLHLTGIVAMFIASKYEDVIPLLMRTVLNKIGHNKSTMEQVQRKEEEILRGLGFKIGQPTIKEFMDTIVNEIHNYSNKNSGSSSSKINISEQFKELCLYVAKLVCHSYQLMQLPSSLLASACLRVAFKLYEKVEPVKDVQLLMKHVTESIGVCDEDAYKDTCKQVFLHVKNFEKNCPNYKNVKNQYVEVINEINNAGNNNAQKCNNEIFSAQQ